MNNLWSEKIVDLEKKAADFKTYRSNFYSQKLEPYKLQADDRPSRYRRTLGLYNKYVDKKRTYDDCETAAQKCVIDYMDIPIMNLEYADEQALKLIMEETKANGTMTTLRTGKSRKSRKSTKSPRKPKTPRMKKDNISGFCNNVSNSNIDKLIDSKSQIMLTRRSSNTSLQSPAKLAGKNDLRRTKTIGKSPDYDDDLKLGKSMEPVRLRLSVATRFNKDDKTTLDTSKMASILKKKNTDQNMAGDTPKKGSYLVIFIFIKTKNRKCQVFKYFRRYTQPEKPKYRIEGIMSKESSILQLK